MSFVYIQLAVDGIKRVTMAKAEELRVLELFSGIGGMHYALEGILHDFQNENWNVSCSFICFY